MIVEIFPLPGIWRRARPTDWTMSMVLVLGWANRTESIAGMSTLPYGSVRNWPENLGRC